MAITKVSAALTNLDGGVVINESSADADFRVESNGNANMLFVDGGNDRVGIGTGSPSTNLHIYSTADNAPHLLLENYQNADTDDAAVIELYLNDETTGGIGDNTDVGVIRFTGDEKDGGSKETYAEIRGVAHDPGQGASTKGNLSFFVQSDGDLHETLTLDEKNVGIGTASPDCLVEMTGAHTSSIGMLHLDSTDHAFIALDAAGATNDKGIYFQEAGTSVAIIDHDGSANQLRIHDGTNTHMVITDGGNVGIGTASPSQLLHVSSTGSAGILLEADSDNVNEDHVGLIQITQDGGGIYSKLGISNANVAYWDVAEFHRFSRQGTEKARIDTSGRLLLNTTSVYSDSNDIFVASGGRSNFTATSLNAIAANRQTDTGDIVTFLYNGSCKGSISTDGSNVAYNTSSDARLKNVLGDAKGLDIVNQLNPVHFEWKETGKTQDGLIAQEVEPLIPESVSTNEQTGFYQMDYGKLVTPLIKAVQEQQEQIEELKQKIETLENA